MSLLDALIEDDAVLTDRKEVFIALRIDGAEGSGTKDDPFNGSTDTLLDGILRSTSKVPKGAIVHFGPGIFQTKGFGGAELGWQPRDFQVFRGAGMHVTTLQLVKAIPVDPDVADSVSAIATEAPTEGVAIADMTVDCNLARQPKQVVNGLNFNAKIKAGAIGLVNATNVRIRRVRVINWGTYAGGVSGLEGFPLYIESDQVSNLKGENLVEDCIVEQPDLSPARETTMLNNHSYPNSRETFCTVRNNYLNGDFTTGEPPTPIEVVKIDGTSIVTKWPHRMQGSTPAGTPADEVYLSGYPNAADNKRIEVSSESDYRTLVLAEAPASIPPGATIMAQRYVPKAMIIMAISRTGNSVTITTPEPHFRRSGTNADTIRLSGVVSNGTTDNLYNGSFKVQAVTANTITYETDSVPPYDPDSQNCVIWLDRWTSQQTIIKSYTWDDPNVTIETGGPHYKAKDEYLAIAEAGGLNGYYKVLNRINSRQLQIERATMPVGVTIATAIVHQNFQGITATTGYGTRVYGNRLAGMNVGGPYHDIGPGTTKDLITCFNYFSWVFKGQYSLAGGQPNREERNVTYSNVMELQTYAPGAQNQAVPGGISFHVDGTGILFDTLIVRDNLIRFFGGGQGNPGPNGSNQFGISVESARNLIAEENIIGYLSTLQPLFFKPATGEEANTTAKFFNNLGPNGAVMLGKDKTTGIHESEPASYAEDVLWVWRRKVDLF